MHSHETITLNITYNVLFLPENCSRFIEKVPEFGYFRLKHLMQTKWYIWTLDNLLIKLKVRTIYFATQL